MTSQRRLGTRVCRPDVSSWTSKAGSEVSFSPCAPALSCYVVTLLCQVCRCASRGSRTHVEAAMSTRDRRHKASMPAAQPRWWLRTFLSVVVPTRLGRAGRAALPGPRGETAPLAGRGSGGCLTRQTARSPDSLLATHHSLSTRLAVSRPRGLSASQTGNLKSTFWHVENPHVSGPTAFEATFGSAQPRRAEPAVPNRTYCVWILRSLTPQQRKL